MATKRKEPFTTVCLPKVPSRGQIEKEYEQWKLFSMQLSSIVHDVHKQRKRQRKENEMDMYKKESKQERMQRAEDPDNWVEATGGNSYEKRCASGNCYYSVCCQVYCGDTEWRLPGALEWIVFCDACMSNKEAYFDRELPELEKVLCENIKE